MKVDLMVWTRPEKPNSKHNGRANDLHIFYYIGQEGGDEIRVERGEISKNFTV